MADPDLLKRLCDPVLQVGGSLVAAAGLPGPLQRSLAALVDASGLLVIAGGWWALGALEPRLRGGRMLRVIAAAAGLGAAPLAIWIATHPSDRFDALFGRWDHLAFAGAAGLALTTFAGRSRAAWLAVIGIAVLLQYAGPVPLAVVVALSAMGLLLLQTPLRLHRGPLIVSQALLVLAAYGTALAIRGWHFELASRVQALLAFWMLRHISLIVAAARTGVPSPLHCGAFLAFYPGVMGLFGAPEVYDEFARRNLHRPPTVQHRRGGRRIIEGVLLVIAALAVPGSIDQIGAAPNAPLAWGYAVVFFVDSALWVMGAWRTIDGAALLYGVQLRANFAGLLSCRNPTELWWAWRGTFTNWLVQFVYSPLGANRRHQSANIAAAFCVSFVWHALGHPFVSPDFRWQYLAPIGLWAALNGLAVIAHVNVVRLTGGRGVGIGPASLRTAVAVLLMWAFAAFTPILSFYHGPATERVWPILAALTGLR